MWRNDTQTSAAITLLLARVRLSHLWIEDGPTDDAIGLLTSMGSALSQGQLVMLRVAFDFWNGCFWNGRGAASLGDVLVALDGENLTAVASLAQAVSRGGDAVDSWIAKERATR